MVQRLDSNQRLPAPKAWPELVISTSCALKRYPVGRIHPRLNRNLRVPFQEASPRGRVRPRGARSAHSLLPLGREAGSVVIRGPVEPFRRPLASTARSGAAGRRPPSDLLSELSEVVRQGGSDGEDGCDDEELRSREPLRGKRAARREAPALRQDCDDGRVCPRSPLCRLSSHARARGRDDARRRAAAAHERSKRLATAAQLPWYRRRSPLSAVRP